MKISEFLSGNVHDLVVNLNRHVFPMCTPDFIMKLAINCLSLLANTLIRLLYNTIYHLKLTVKLTKQNPFPRLVLESLTIRTFSIVPQSSKCFLTASSSIPTYK